MGAQPNAERGKSVGFYENMAAANLLIPVRPMRTVASNRRRKGRKIVRRIKKV